MTPFSTYGLVVRLDPVASAIRLTQTRSTHEEPMADPKAISGKGFIIMGRDSTVGEWYETFDEAQTAAIQYAAKEPVAIYECVGVLRPKADVVAKFTGRGAELSKASKALPSGDEVAVE